MTDTQRLNQITAPLVARARAGERDALDALLSACYPQIYRWALVQVGDPDDAQDVTQEVLMRLHTSIRRYGGRARFTTWLYRVTRNAAGDFGRRQRRRARLKREAAPPEVEAAPEAPARLDTSAVAGVVRRFLRELPARQREVLDLVDLQEHTPSEVAAMLEINPITVRAHLLRARRALRAWVLERHPALAEEYRS